MPVTNSLYIKAQMILEYTIEKLENEPTESSMYCLQWINLQMAKFKCQSYLDMLQCYPLEIVDIVDESGIN